MANCKNCLTSIDMRSVKYCSSCNMPLHKDCAIKDGGAFYCDVCFTVKTEDKKLVEDIKIPDVIRRSYIDVYKECPYKFYYEVIKGKERPDNIYALIGSDIHNLIEKACCDKEYTRSDMEIDYKKIWNEYPDELFESEEQKEKLYKRAKQSIHNFYKLLPELPGKPHSTEENIEFSVGNDMPKISTTSDRIDLIQSKLEVIDWKTGAVMVGQKISSDIQAPLYIYGVQQKYNMPVNSFTFYYLNEDKSRTFNRIDDNNFVCQVRKREYFINLYDAIKSVQRIFSKIKKGVFDIPNDMKSMYYTCKICHLREDSTCQGAEVESWKQLN